MNTKNALIAFLLLAGCQENKSINQSNSAQSFFPVARGNQWVYKDSINSTVSTTMTEVVSSSIDSNGVMWWNLNNQSVATGFLGTKFTIRNDSIYSLQTVRGGRERLGLLLVPPCDTNFVFYRDGGDVGFRIEVTMGKAPCQIPAGNFNDWASYVFNSGLERDSVIIAPGIGVLSRTLEGIAYPGRPAYKICSVLLSYRLL